MAEDLERWKRKTWIFQAQDTVQGAANCRESQILQTNSV